MQSEKQFTNFNLYSSKVKEKYPGFISYDDLSKKFSSNQSYNNKLI